MISELRSMNEIYNNLLKILIYLDGVHSTHQIGLFPASGLSIFIFSSPTLSLIDIVPLKNPSAMYCPSLVHEQQVILEDTLVFGTDLSLNDHKPIHP